MRNKLIVIGLIVTAIFGFSYYGATNFDRIVLGSANYSEDPNTTADITLQNDEYITNATDGVVSIVSPTLTLSSTVRGTDAFTTTATEDTVTISGATTADIYVVSGKYTAGVDQQDVLEWEALTGKLVVHRLASGESALGYSFIRIR